MLKKIYAISLALPGALLNLTSPKAPSTATDVPRLPFTIMITAATKTGSTTSIMARLLPEVSVNLNAMAITKPKSNAAPNAIHTLNIENVPALKTLSNIPRSS